MKVTLNVIQTSLTVSLLAGVLLAGCQDISYPAPSPATAASTIGTRVQLVNATPDASALNFRVENAQAGTPLAPGQTTGYQALPVAAAAAASPTLRANGAGGTLGTTDLISRTVLSPNPLLAYTWFVTDTINRPRAVNAQTGAVTDAGGVRGLFITDTLTAPSAGNAEFRFFHLAPDVGAVSVRLINSAGVSAGTLNNRTYRQATGAVLNYTVVPAGAYVAQVYSGTAVPASLTVTPAVSATLNLASTKIYTVYAQGLARRGTLRAGVLTHN